jgi:hypothetical protein
MSRVRGDTGHRSFVTIDGQRVEAGFRQPEDLLHPLAQVVRSSAQPPRLPLLPLLLQEFGQRQLGREQIALEFDGRQRQRGKSAIRMHDGITSIFPALVVVASSAPGGVLLQPILVPVAKRVAPVERRARRRQVRR